MKTMLILRGIASSFSGINYPNGALHEQAAIDYARLRGYTPKVLTVSGEAYDNAPQVQYALREMKQDASIQALYGFSGGGYNIRHVLDNAPRAILDRLTLVVVLGTPKNPAKLYAAAKYNAKWELVYRLDPDDPQGGHMAGPDVLLAEAKTQFPGSV